MATAFTLAEIKAAAAITSTTYDQALPGWIESLEAAVEQFTGLTLISRTATAWLDGNWSQTLVLPGRPVPAVTTVRVWDAFSDLYADVGQANFHGQNPAYTGTPPAALTLGVDYALAFDKQWNARNYSLSGRLRRNGAVWPGRVERKPGRVSTRRVNGSGNVQVDYTYGFVDPKDIPPVFLAAVAAGVRGYILRIPSGGLVPTSQSLDGASVGSQVADSGAASGTGLFFPELASVRDAMKAYVAPRIY